MIILIMLAALAVSASSVTASAAEKAAPLLEEQVLFQGGDCGYACYRVPALAVTTRGTVLAFAEARKDTGYDWDNVDLALRRSFDGGRTWTQTQFIADPSGLTMANPCPVVDRTTGTVWLLLGRGSELGRSKSELLVMKSTDDGATWSEPVNITTTAKNSSWPFVGTGPGHGIQLKSGRLLVPCWADATPNLGESQFSYCFYSDDHGVSWKLGRPLANNASECAVVELVDGTVYLNARTRGSRQRAHARSSDGGHGWSVIEYDAAQPTAPCQGSAIRLTDTSRFQKNRVAVCHPADPHERAQLAVRLSYDECRTWPVSKVLAPQGYSAYSDLAVTRDHDILCLYEAFPSYKDAHLQMKLVLKRFNIEWLTDEKDHLQPK